MKVFISWSGERSRQIADALSDFVKQVIQTVEPFVSSNIKAGEVWFKRLASELQTTGFAILCLTPDNMDEPWVLFEAGAVFGSRTDSVVCACLCGGLTPDKLESPLSQFQANVADREGTKRIIHALNMAVAANEETFLEPDDLDRQFKRCWPELQRRLKPINKLFLPIQSPGVERKTRIEPLAQGIRPGLAFTPRRLVPFGMRCGRQDVAWKRGA